MPQIALRRGADILQEDPSNHEEFSWIALLAKARKALAEGVEVRVDPSSIRRMPDQPRKYFNEDSLRRLADSMESIGQIQAGIIRRVTAPGGIKYELLDGERRWRAATMKGLDYKASLIEVDDEVIPFIIAAVANFNRENHTPTEVSDSIARMYNLGIPMEEIASALGISLHWAYQMHGLQNLHPEVRDMLDPNLGKKVLGVSAAIQIAKVDLRLQLGLAKKILSRSLSLAGLRKEALRVSKEAGAHIRERQLEPNKRWLKIQANVRLLKEKIRDLESELSDPGLDVVLKDRRRNVSSVLEDLHTIMEVSQNSRRLIRRAQGTL